MPKERHSESGEARQRRLDKKAEDRTNARASEEQLVDEMIKKSIQLHGA